MYRPIVSLKRERERERELIHLQDLRTGIYHEKEALNFGHQEIEIEREECHTAPLFYFNRKYKSPEQNQTTHMHTHTNTHTYTQRQNFVGLWKKGMGSDMCANVRAASSPSGGCPLWLYPMFSGPRGPCILEKSGHYGVTIPAAPEKMLREEKRKMSNLACISHLAAAFPFNEVRDPESICR